MKLVTPELFSDCWVRKRLLPKCQEVLPQFFVDVDALTDKELGTLEVVAISYCWIAKNHPDPQMYHLEDVYHMLKKFVVGTFDAIRSGTHLTVTSIMSVGTKCMAVATADDWESFLTG